VRQSTAWVWISHLGGRDETGVETARRVGWRVGVVAGVAVLFLLLIALVEGDIPEAVSDLTSAVRHRMAGLGPAASFVILYLEESGVPLPVPGDVFVLYLGQAGAGRPALLVLYWLGAIVTVVLGSTNLYILSRHLGPRILEGRLGRLIHVTPERLAKAEEWFGRYGALTVIFGRHVPGLRIPITVAAGVFQFPYHVFVPSVAVSTAIWAGVWIVLGARFGGRVARFLDLHRPTYLVIPILLLVVLAIFVVRRRLASARAGTDPEHAGR
jgi:membrane protein DedA with SNARE-associated domain